MAAGDDPSSTPDRFDQVPSAAWVLAGLLLLVSAACGPSTGPAPPAQSGSSLYWVAGSLPDGFIPVLLEENSGRRTIRYTHREDDNDVFDAPLGVTAAEVGDTRGDRDDDDVEIRGRPASVAPLIDDGRTYGVEVTWQEANGVWVTVSGAEPLTRAEVLAVAEGLTPVDAEEWGRLRRALSLDTHVGRVEPGAAEMVAITGTVAGEQYQLVVLVPADYPLGPEDRRLSCYHVTFRGDRSPDLCDTHPWWLRIGGQIFVFGPASADTTAITIGPYEGARLEPVTVGTAGVDAGPPSRFYVAALPEGTCFVEVGRADGGADPNLGPIGPLPGNPEHPACLAAR